MATVKGWKSPESAATAKAEGDRKCMDIMSSLGKTVNLGVDRKWKKYTKAKQFASELKVGRTKRTAFSF